MLCLVRPIHPNPIRMDKTPLQMMAYDRIIENMHTDVQAAIKDGLRPEPYNMPDGNALWLEWKHLVKIFGSKQRFLMEYFFPAAQHINKMYDLKYTALHG